MILINILVDFNTWKATFEEETSSSYIKSTGIKRNLDDDSVCYYYCNRSGYYRDKGSGKRAMKSQGTSKLNTYCTAAIRTITLKQTNEIQAEVCSTHYGHSTNLEHLRLPEIVRLSVAAQLTQGVSLQKILDNVRDNVTGNWKRVHLLSRKDITNIEKSYHINSVSRHKDDAISVHCWVNEMKEKKRNKSSYILQTSRKSTTRKL